MERKKFTTTISERTYTALEVIRDSLYVTNKNDVIELLVNKYLKENNLEEIVNAKFKKDKE